MAFTSKDIEKFCSIDGGWERRSGSNHIIATKYLEDGNRLQVQICHDKTKSFSPGACNRICKEQLGLSGGEKEFHDVLRTGVAPERSGLDMHMQEQDDTLTTQTTDALLYECKMGQYQIKDFTEAEGEKIVVAQRFGTPIGSMQPAQVRTALDVISEYRVADDFEVYQVFEAAGANFGSHEIAEVMSLQVPSPSLSSTG